MFFNSIKEINRLGKEIHRLLIKGMSSIYLKVTIEKTDVLKTSKFQLTQILNFKTSFCKLKIKGLGAKLWVAFLLF